MTIILDIFKFSSLGVIQAERQKYYMICAGRAGNGQQNDHIISSQHSCQILALEANISYTFLLRFQSYDKMRMSEVREVPGAGRVKLVMLYSSLVW